MTAKLILGSAQFGLDYGIANAAGRTSRSEICAMLDLARSAGIGGVDTAAAYGDAETILGQCGVADFDIITKFSAPTVELARLDHAIEAGARNSIAALGCRQLDGYLLHSAAELTGTRATAIHRALVRIREGGFARRIGISVYSRDHVEPIVSRYPVDLVQLPISVLDQRACEWLPRLIDSGIAIHVRSIFLQGLLLRSADRFPPRVAALADGVSSFHRRAVETGLSPLEAALAFARDLPGIQAVVVGAGSRRELQQIVTAFAKDVHFDAEGLDMSHLPETDPRTWTQV